MGNPTDFHLTEGQAHDLQGADVFLEDLEAEALLADKAFDADERVLKKLEEKGIEAVIPPKSNRKAPREYDKELYKARHLIENFFAKLKQYRGIATRYDKLASTFPGGIFLCFNCYLAQLVTRPSSKWGYCLDDLLQTVVK